MRHVFDTVVNSATGLPVPGAVISVIDQNGAPVQLYKDNGFSPVTGTINQVSTNSLGLYSFYVAAGVYTLTATFGLGQTVAIGDIQIDQPSYAYDATYDILVARLRPGFTGDTDAINKALASNSEVFWTTIVGGILADKTIIVPPNCVLRAQGQLTPIVRIPELTGDTLTCGKADGSINAGSVVLSNLWFVQTGRLGYSGGALANMLSNGASHISIYGGQAARVKDCGGYGMPYGLSFFHCGGIYIENPFWYGGVYNPLLPSAQESIAQIRAASSPISHNVNVEIVSPEMYGGNTLGYQSRAIGANTVQAVQHCGPAAALLVESAECLGVRGGFVGGYAISAIQVAASASTDILMRMQFNGTYIDESNSSCFSITRNGAQYPLLDGLEFFGCDFNGQIVAVNAIVMNNPAALQSVRRVKISSSQFRAFLGAPVQDFGADNCDIVDCEFAGYNLANNSQPSYSAGVYAAGNANDLHLRNCQFGGGANLYTEDNSVYPANTTGNGCMYGVYGDAGSSGTYAFLRARNLAKPGGNLITGTLTQAVP